ncbi:MAG: type transporter, partial [Mycobacterium sp.]|nr:type transporter [Mycobacterium sp.]
MTTLTAGSAPLYTPDPGAAPWHRMLLAQTLIELKLTLRRGESVLLTLIIPVGLLL